MASVSAQDNPIPASEAVFMPEMLTLAATPRRGERADRIRMLRDRYPHMSQAEIARRADCSEQNVSQVLSAYLEPFTPADIDEFRADKAVICESLQHRLLSSITQEKLDKTPAVSLITGFAILEDKIRVMNGLPTSIHVNALMDVASMLRAQRDSQSLERQQVTPPIQGDIDDDSDE